MILNEVFLMKTKGTKLVHTSKKGQGPRGALADMTGFSFFELLQSSSQGPAEVSLWSFVSMHSLYKVMDFVLTFSHVSHVIGSSPLSIMVSCARLPCAGPFFLLTVSFICLPIFCSPLSVTAKVLSLLLSSSPSAGLVTL